MSEVLISDPTKEIGYYAKRGTLYALGKGAAEPAAESLVPAVLGKPAIQALASAAGQSVLGMITIGLTAAISGGLTLMDYNHKRDTLKDLYKEELTSLTGKPKDKVTSADLDQLAKVNGTVNEELKRSKRQRNFGVFISFAASLAALTVVGLVAPAIIGAALPVLGISASGVGAGLLGFAVKGVIAFLSYEAVKEPLHLVADKVFKIDERTTNDHIVSMKMDREVGKIISREQVLAAFVAANPELDQLIVSSYGKHFNDLDVATKQRASQDMNQLIPLDKLTIEINAGRINVTELAFSVQGQSTGVEHDGTEAPSKDHKKGLNKLLIKMEDKINHTKIGHQVERVVTAALAPDQFVTPVSGQDKSPIEPFVERLGLKKKDKSMAHVDRVEQSRADQATAIQQP